MVDESPAQALSQLHTLSPSAAQAQAAERTLAVAAGPARAAPRPLGGVSAYDTCLCMRLFALSAQRGRSTLPEGLFLNKYFVVVGGSYNLQRLMVLDLRTPDLATGPAAAMPTGRTRIALSDDARRNINMLRRCPSAPQRWRPRRATVRARLACTPATIAPRPRPTGGDHRRPLALPASGPKCSGRSRALRVCTSSHHPRTAD